MPYASDKNAYGISDRSGFRYRLKDMRVEWTGAKVGKDELKQSTRNSFLLGLAQIRKP